MTTHTGFSPQPESPATTSTMISDISMSNINLAGCVLVLPFHVVGTQNDHNERSRSTTPGRNSRRDVNSPPDQHMLVQVNVQQNDIQQTDMQQQLLSMRQQVSNMFTVNKPVSVTSSSSSYSA